MCDDHGAQKPVPRWTLRAMFGMAALSIVIAFLAPMVGGKQKVATIGTTPIAVQALLHFEDRAAGRVAVVEASSGQTIATLFPGSFGFIRTVMRSMAHARLKLGRDRTPPFRIARTVDQRFFVDDPETGKSIYLNAFGLTNAKTFGALLDAAETVQRSTTFAKSERR